MAVELSVAKGSLKATAVELGISPQILTRWRREQVGSPGTNASGRAQLSQDQQEIQRLKKELKQAELERIAEATRHPKKGGRHLLQERPRGGPWEIFRFIKAHQIKFSTVRRCG
jgi:transposase